MPWSRPIIGASASQANSLAAQAASRLKPRYVFVVITVLVVIAVVIVVIIVVVVFG